MLDAPKQVPLPRVISQNGGGACNPPPFNYQPQENSKMTSEIKCLYSGVDNLEVAFMGALNAEGLAALETAKERAQTDMLPALIWLGKTECSVAETGAKGGYAYRLDTGDDGETWFVKHSVNRKEWNLRVSVKAKALVLYGYEGVKARIYERLEAMGATVMQESIGRVDLCVDLMLPGFELQPENIISPAQSTQSDHGDMNVHRRARRVDSITLGKMPGRQICIYNKRREAKIKRNLHWFDVWGLDRDENSSENPVWRVEIRAGKRYLSEQLNVKTWAELDAVLPDFVKMTMEAYRIIGIKTGQNVSRWATHEFWHEAHSRLMAITNGELCGIVPGRIVSGKRRVLQETYETLIVGLAASLSEVCQTDDVPTLAQTLAQKINNAALNQSDWNRRRQRAKRRLSITDEFYQQEHHA